MAWTEQDLSNYLNTCFFRAVSVRAETAAAIYRTD